MANLYNKAGLVNIPIGYSDGFLYNIKPVDDTLAFRFNRDSAATRVNKEGLIEQVSYFGPELVTNGDFATDSDWQKTNAVIEDGVGKLQAGTYTRFRQNTGFTGQAKVTYTISFNNSSNTTIQLRGFGGQVFQNSPATVGTHTVYINYISEAVVFQSNYLASGEEIHLDNVSVKEVGQNWTFGDEWSMGDGKAVRTGTGSTALSQSFSALQNKKFRLSFKVLDWTVGHLKGYFYGGGGSDEFFDSTSIGNGSFTFEVTTTTNRTNFAFLAFGSFDGSIDNVSIIEITDDTDIPRIDYTTGFGSLLLEPQSTNLVTYSEDFSQWIKDGGASIESGYLAPDGSNNAYKVSGTSSSFLYLASITNTTDTRTIWARTVSGTGDVYLCGNLNDANALFTVTSQWQRFELNGFTGGGATNFYAVDFRGSSTLTEVIVWGAQVEALSYATSYIPTEGSAVTRAADVANNSGNADLINSTEGVLYAEISALSNTSDGSKYIAISDGTYNNRASILFSNGATNQIRTFLRVGGVSQIDVSDNVTDVTDFNKVAFSYKENDFKVYINGSLVSSDTSGSVWSENTITKLSFSEINTSANFFNGKTKELAVFKEALTDAELESLTSWVSFTEMATDLEYTVE